jgi:hypothetical protein
MGVHQLDAEHLALAIENGAGTYLLKLLRGRGQLQILAV